MASTTKEKAKAREYYKKNKKYREKKIEKVVEKQKANPEEHRNYQKEYYHETPKYKKYKRAYAKQYRKENPTKSLARKDRKAVKKK